MYFILFKINPNDPFLIFPSNDATILFVRSLLTFVISICIISSFLSEKVSKVVRIGDDRQCSHRKSTMKFTEYLELNFAPTLSRHCIAYEEMKRCLYEVAGKRLQDSSSCAVHSNAALSSSSPPIDEEFFQVRKFDLPKKHARMNVSFSFAKRN